MVGSRGMHANGVPSSDASCVSVPPSSTPLASPCRNTSSPAGASVPIGTGCATAPSSEARS